MLKVNERIQVPLKEFEFSFARGSGPGGQAVNKQNTKVTLRWAILDTPSLPSSVKEKFIAANKRRISGEGEFLISSHRFRDQGRNVADCLNKLRELILKASEVRKKRIPTKPGKRAKQRRLDNKRANSARKQMRKPPSSSD